MTAANRKKVQACIITLLSLCADTNHFHERLPDFTSNKSEIIKDRMWLLQCQTLKGQRTTYCFRAIILMLQQLQQLVAKLQGPSASYSVCTRVCECGVSSYNLMLSNLYVLKRGGRDCSSEAISYQEKNWMLCFCVVAEKSFGITWNDQFC